MENTRAEAHRLAWAERAGRRRLLLKAMTLGAAGLAAGGVAAWTKGELDSAATTGVTLADTKRQLETADAAKAALALSYSTLQTQANNWQSQLATTAAQNAQLAGAVNAAQQQAGDLKAKLAAAQTALKAANDRLTHSQELINLYNQLDGVGLDNVVANGLGILDGALAGVAGPAGLLKNGLDSAHSLLTDFEQVLPNFSGAMAWLGNQVVKIKVALWAVETTAQQAANSTLSGVTAVFGGFVGFVLDHLPFNIGANVRKTLSEVQNLLAGVTAMSDQAADQVLLKISHYVDDGPQGWKQTLVTPLRTNTLAPAGEVLAAVSGASEAYKTSLNDPAHAALQQRQVLRDQISAFRSTHGI
jgi:hypothetical protein